MTSHFTEELMKLTYLSASLHNMKLIENAKFPPAPYS